MGQFDDPLNTFGELFYQAACTVPGCTSSRWSLVTPPGVASNGGIMIAGNPDGALTAGFGVSLDLTFSPLAETTDHGSAWTAGILPAGLVPVPDSLAASGPGRRLALVSTRGGEVQASGTDLSTWTPLVQHRALAASAHSAGCALGRLTAVTITAAGDDLVAGTCTGGGRAGVFRLGAAGSSGAVTEVGPRLVDGPGGAIRIDRLVAAGSTISALIVEGGGAASDTGEGSTLYLATSADDAATWTVSAPLATGGRAVSATSVTPIGGFVVLLGSRGGVETAHVVAPGVLWQPLPAPPRGTSVVAARPDGLFDALIPVGGRLDVDSLAHGSWIRSQVVHLPIQYGST